MMQTGLRIVVISVCAAASVGLSGCSRGNPTDAALAKAQQAVDVALDGWSRGESPDKFACTDPDWKAGARLLSFLTADAEVVNGNAEQVRCRVALTLKDRQGKRHDRNVSYLVQLSEPVTIRRDDKK
jgi:hypothetical protein